MRMIAHRTITSATIPRNGHRAASLSGMNISTMLLENQQCGFRTSPTQTEMLNHKRWLEAGYFGFRKWRNCPIHRSAGLRHRYIAVTEYQNLSHHMRKPTISVSNQVRHRPVCTVTEERYKLEALDISSR